MGVYQPCPVSNLPESRFPNLRNSGFQNAGLAVSGGQNIQKRLSRGKNVFYPLAGIISVCFEMVTFTSIENSGT